MALSAVIFDMDGVIFDTERLCRDSWRETAAKYGIDDIDEVFPQCIGSAEWVTRELFRVRYGDNLDFDAFRADAAVIFNKAGENGGFPKKRGVTELLTYLKERSIKAGVASSTVTKRVRAELKEAGLDVYFDVIVGGDCVKRSKPEPDIFLHCLSLLGAAKEDALIIEDSHNGVKAAANAGIRCIMVPDLLPPTDETNALAFRTLPSLVEVKELLLEARY